MTDRSLDTWLRERRILVGDGGMGTLLQAAGLPAGACPEVWNQEQPDAVGSIMKSYAEAGAELLETNTFGGSPHKLAAYGLGERCEELNRAAADLLRTKEPNAVTDVTGFGLFGHAMEIAERSGVRLVLEGERFPALPGALEAAASGVRTGGDVRNRDFVEGRVQLDGLPAAVDALGHDPQTAGGLLVSIPAAKGPVLEAEFAQSDLFLAQVGHVEAGSGVVAH